MNLKLCKSKYKNDKNKSQLDYSFFGNYIKQYKTKLVFTGGFGGISKTKKVFLKKQHSQMNSYDRQYQLSAIIRNYNDMRKTIHPRNKQNVISFLTEKKRSNTLTKNSIMTSGNNNCNPLNSFYLNTTKRECNLKNKNKTSIHSKSAFKETITSLLNKNTKRNLNMFRSSIDQTNSSYNKGKLTKYNKTFFSDRRNLEDKHDRNSIMERLKLKYNFFIIDKENEFEKKKWKMFKKKDDLSMKVLPKHSLHWIELMNRRDRMIDL